MTAGGTSNGEIVHQLARIANALEELVRVARERDTKGRTRPAGHMHTG